MIGLITYIYGNNHCSENRRKHINTLFW
jgi:hypothetical protein